MMNRRSGSRQGFARSLAATLVFVVAQGGFQELCAEEADAVIVSADEAHLDLDDLQRQFEQRFAYLRANNVAVDDAIREAKADITDTISARELSDRIAKLIALFIDGHAGPRLNTKSDLELPFRIEMSGPRYVAVKPDRSGFLDEAKPFIRRIAGYSIERWIAAADPYLAEGSPQLVRRRAVRAIERFSVLAEKAGIQTDGTVVLELFNDDGESMSMSVNLMEAALKTEDVPEVSTSGILPGNIGYLRIPSFSRAANVPELINEWMPRFEETAALIIDVRGNGGGNRIGLVELFPYFLREGELRIANVSAYRLYPEFGEDHLSDARFSYMENDDRWKPWERQVIHDFRRSFKPEWVHRSSEFSDWHYMLLSKRKGDPRYYYGNDVYVLTDGGCFSATDIFVGAFKGFRNTIIVGQPTSGGSARSVSEELPHSRISVRLASMISFQPDGQLYDGRGIHPDIHIAAAPGSFLAGGKDNVLDRVLEIINNSNEGQSVD